MAGFSKIFCIGDLGGYMGADGINPILLQIWVGDADRQWLEAHYFDDKIKRLGNIRSIVPKGPNDRNMLIDACIVYYPEHFADCPTLQIVEKKLASLEFLDFNLGWDVPPEWIQLRKEARKYFKRLHIFEADLKELNF